MNQSLFKRPFFWYGIYYGIASILMFTIIYSVNFEFFGRFFLWIFISIAVMAIFMIMGGLAERKFQGGYRKYGKAFLDLFLIGIIGSILNLVFNIIFVNFIDTDFYTNLAEVMKESTRNFMQSFGEVPDEKMDEAMANMDKQFANANTPLAYLKTLVFNYALFSLIMALLCALFVKRNPPENLMATPIPDVEN